MHRGIFFGRTSAQSIVFLACVTAFGLANAVASASDDQPLKGPAVKDQGVPGEARKFGTDQKGDKKDRNPAIQHGLFMRAVNSLRGSSADEKVRLSDDQAGKIDAIDSEFKGQAREYMTSHRDEVKKLMADLPEKERRAIRENLGRGPENAGDAKGEKSKHAPAADKAKPDAAPVDAEKASAARARLKEIREGAPQVTEVHAKIFAILSADQKAAVEASIKKFKEEHAKDGKDGKIGKEGKGPLAGLSAADREQLRDKLKNLSPDERRAAIQKLRAQRGQQDDADAPKK